MQRRTRRLTDSEKTFLQKYELQGMQLRALKIGKNYALCTKGHKGTDLRG
jgi:hypothetical protein